ncbi:hypothetical protein COU62_03165 [Candidatus Pacearchaeota archaeon CG10_big_fil_rev_8_21_14_0_10_35_219]|nr:hypothetical protein [Candidatus Pacearchaeota archaeon]OIO42057.1 MAG: hypothetical protein AUJ63_04160 [Candidatus Pacearchaeota archaeon CG1_02_35_32]PIO07622.1 MAG: hypothetical protein COU62_03165 [Candidatus Pacearchaeota archaeon CG10_big_fil_rev_8_21_14_0_10_35_219]PIY81140.1 MAG: hypothetical protein COY79_04225 [Candidatus Pacearchaeota archaeon CG_4_10_14_0_8_um_filter_35_169]PIZ79737.1 MAG: hypothetical protein COY00_03585 [Candidatus Pacearchaeota archaeon CG_4_10_14_0_2_um_filt
MVKLITWDKFAPEVAVALHNIAYRMEENGDSRTLIQKIIEDPTTPRERRVGLEVAFDGARMVNDNKFDPTQYGFHPYSN